MLLQSYTFRVLLPMIGMLCASLPVTVTQPPTHPPLPSASTPSASAALLASLSSDDVRLTRKVALHVEGEAIGDLLEQLSVRTGITLTVQKDIAEEKVIAFTPARPLCATLDDLAALFNNQWERVEGDKTRGEIVRYRLIRGIRAREYEDSLLRGPRERMMAQMNEMVRALGETPEQLRERPASDIVRACLLDPERRLATDLYSSLNLAQREQLFTRGCTPCLFFSTLPPSQQNTLREWLDAHNAVERKRDEVDNLEQQPYPKRDSGVIPSSQFERSGFRLIVLSNVSAGEADVRLQLGISTYLPLRHLRDDKPPRLPRHGNPYTGQPVAKQAELPTQEALQTAAKEKNWIDQLRALAQAANRPVLSDYFRSAPQQHADLLTGVSSAPIPGTSAPMAHLDSFSRSLQRVWWLRADTLLLRTQQWYRQRQYEPSDRWMQDTSRRLRAQRDIPSYADMERVLELTPQQAFGLSNMYNPISIAAETDRAADGVLEYTRLVCELKGANRQPLFLREDPRTTLSRPSPGTKYAAAGGKRVASLDLPWEDLPASARPLAVEALSSIYPVDYVEPIAVQYVAYCEYPSVLAPLVPNPAIDKARSENFRRRNLPNISADERQELEAERQADVLRQVDYMLNGPRKRDERYVEVVSKVRLTVPNVTGGRGATLNFDRGAVAILPLVIPDDRRDKTKIEVISK